MFASMWRLSVQDMARLRISDAYSVHRVVYDLFEQKAESGAGGEASPSSGILFADKGMKKDLREILIVSDRSPRHVPRGDLECKEIPAALLNFSDYHFEITLNPVKRENATGKLIPLRTREDVAAWFINKAPGWGFEADEEHLEITALGLLNFKKKGQDVTLGQATLAGRLHVREKDKFAKSFSQGIGRGKAFGCGLLQISPIA